MGAGGWGCPMTPECRRIIHIAERADDSLYCYDFKDEPGFPGCCTSCHDDVFELGYDLCETDIITTRGSVRANVCCKVLAWLGSVLGGTAKA